jgi:hypothetical protein
MPNWIKHSKPHFLIGLFWIVSISNLFASMQVDYLNQMNSGDPKSSILFKAFDLVAHVRIIEKSNVVLDSTLVSCEFQIKFEVNEYFVKNDSNTIWVRTNLNSPLAIIQANEEWIIYANILDGKIVMNSKSDWYRKPNGLKNWAEPFFTDPLIELRKFYWNTYEPTFPFKVITKYKNGKPELIENYLKNELEGKRNIYSPNGVLLFEGTYKVGNPDGDFKIYYPTGQLKSYYQYLSGTLFKNSIEYSDTSYYASSKRYKNTYSQNCIKTEKYYDSLGFLVIQRDYDRYSKLLTELIFNSSEKIEKRINFNQDGSINSIDPPNKKASIIEEKLIENNIPEIDSTEEFNQTEIDSINSHSVVFELTKQNIIYLGLENPISIACVGIPNKSLLVKSSKGSKIIHLGGTEYLISIIGDTYDFPRECKIEVFYLDENNRKVKIGYKSFRVREIPRPKIALGFIKEDGFVKAKNLENINFLFLFIPDMTLCGIRYIPTSYKIAFSIDNKPDEIFIGKSTELTEAIKERLKNCKKGERIVVYDVKGKGPAGPFNIIDRLVLMVE